MCSKATGPIRTGFSDKAKLEASVISVSRTESGGVQVQTALSISEPEVEAPKLSRKMIRRSSTWRAKASPATKPRKISPSSAQAASWRRNPRTAAAKQAELDALKAKANAGNRNEAVEHRACPAHVAKALELAGGKNRFGQPNFRVVWGYDRIVPITGEWQEFEQLPRHLARQTDGLRRITAHHAPQVFRHRDAAGAEISPGKLLAPRDVATARGVRIARGLGKAGQEVVGCLTIDTAGPYPSQGEYELCYPLTHDGTSHGTPIDLWSPMWSRT
jgi:hypothetical protein